MASVIKQLQIPTRAEWRKWLVENHDKHPSGIWLVFRRKQTGRPSLEYEEAVEEALCFGWIDSILKKIDDERYCRKFTPRKDRSRWSSTNKRRVEKIVKEGRMTEFGLAKVTAARKLGIYEMDPRPVISMDVPQDLSEALAGNRTAKDFFAGLAATYRKQFIAWITMARKPEIRTRRLQESLALLARGEKLGLK